MSWSDAEQRRMDWLADFTESAVHLHDCDRDERLSELEALKRRRDFEGEQKLKEAFDDLD